MRLSETFTKVSRGWVIIVAVLVFFLFMMFVLPGQAIEAEEASGGAGSPDTSLWYSPDELYQFAEVYGVSGRAAYVQARWSFDLIYPLVYTFFLTATLSWLFARLYPATSFWRTLNLVPVAGMIFDYLENVATSIVMLRYPLPSLLAAAAAPLLTLLKWIFVAGSFLLLLIGALQTIHRRLTYR